MKYVVLKDFWLRDVCLKKGQIITDPVSPRWFRLGLIGFYSDLETKGFTESQIDTVKKIEELENLKVDSDVSAVVDGEEVRKRRPYTRRKKRNIIYNKPEVSEVIVNDLNT
jgi:hypothetical protein